LISSFENKNVLIIGGGRWARVIVEVILDLLPDTSQVFIFSAKNSEAMSVWTREKKIESKTVIVSDLLDLDIEKITAAIVVNAARDHEKAAEWAIQNGLPVLVEKPVTLNINSTKRLMKLANEKKNILTAAHVFRFSRYLENFSHALNNQVITSIKIHWMDAKSEIRHGEQKSYDSSLPIYKDVLPHILSILATLCLPLPEQIENMTLTNGGSDLEMEFLLGNIPCFLKLTRDGNKRKRLIKVETESDILKMDFTKEPGMIINQYSQVNADPDWNLEMRPLASMLTAFLNSVSSGLVDNRLDITFGLKVNEFIDRTAFIYDTNMINWLLKQEFPISDELENYIKYALSEILQKKSSLEKIELNQKIEKLKLEFQNILKSISLGEVGDSELFLNTMQ